MNFIEKNNKSIYKKLKRFKNYKSNLFKFQ